MARSRGPTAGNGAGNRILDALPPDEYEALAAQLERVELEIKDPVYRRGEPIEHVHFPVSAVMSLVAGISDGRVVEVATVGNEGIAGIPVFLQAAYTSAHDAFAQIPGESLRLRADAFADAAASGGMLHALLQRYTQALFTQIAQQVACNRLHSMEQRCARWLLMTHDRVSSDEFPLTQEFLAQMLGVQRTSVSTVAADLQARGLIRYARGLVAVVDRKGLEAAACECYGVVVGEFERLVA